MLLVNEDEAAFWRSHVSAATHVLAFDDNYLLQVHGNVKAALAIANAQPYETLYLCCDGDELDEAVATRCGTLLVGMPHDALADVLAANMAEAVDLADRLRRSESVGYFAEVASTAIDPGKVANTSGRILIRDPAAFGDIREQARVIALGRSFKPEDTRSKKHQLTRRILDHVKRARPDQTLASVLGDAIAWVHSTTPVDTITRIPPRPGDTNDGVGHLLTAACQRAERTDPGMLARLNLGAATCTRPYLKQKQVGSYENRRANVDGAFRSASNVRGQHVLLVDDVLTSGHTAAEVARTVLAAGADRVTCLILGENQNVVLAWTGAAYPCPLRTCGGELMLRFNQKEQSAFWTCSNHFKTGCDTIVPWRPGLEAWNATNSRDSLDDDRDVTF
jgi:phosphoribosylpyrophosphate synthetase